MNFNQTGIKIGKKIFPTDATLGKLVAQYEDAKRRMDDLQEEMNTLHLKIVTLVRPAMDSNKTKTAHVLYLDLDATVTNRDKWVIESANAAAIKGALGRNYKTLVKEHTEYRPKADLQEIAEDPEHKLYSKVFPYMTKKAGKEGIVVSRTETKQTK